MRLGFLCDADTVMEILGIVVFLFAGDVIVYFVRFRYYLFASTDCFVDRATVVVEILSSIFMSGKVSWVLSSQISLNP